MLGFILVALACHTLNFYHASAAANTHLIISSYQAHRALVDSSLPSLPSPKFLSFLFSYPSVAPEILCACYMGFLSYRKQRHFNMFQVYSKIDEKALSLMERHHNCIFTV